MIYTKTYTNDLITAKDAVCNIEKIYHSQILVTGATGLVCSALIDFFVMLNDNYNAGITIFIAARKKDLVKKRYGDILLRSDVVFVEYDALHDCKWSFNLDYIVHGASPANPTLYVKQPVETMLANIIGIKSILRYAYDRDVKRVLFISSSEVYGNKNNTDPYNETEYGFVDILNPRACYPTSKRACETLCASYKAEYGVSSVIARLGHVYGPTAKKEDTRASSQFFYDVIDGHDIIMKSAGLQMRSYCYVVDCVSALVAILVNGEDVNAYNVSNPNSIVSIRDLAGMIAKLACKRVVYENPSDAELQGYNLMSNSSLVSEKLEKIGWYGQFSLEIGVDHTLRILQGA